MLLRHATPKRNLSSINQLGLLCSKSKGKLKVVWLHSPGKTSWATLHTVKRHGGKVQDVVTLEVDVPREWLRKSRKGVWTSTRDISPDRIRQTIGFSEVASTSERACFYATPRSQCYAPAKTFRDEQKALQWAQKQANAHRIGYAIYRRENGRYRLVQAVNSVQQPQR